MKITCKEASRLVSEGLDRDLGAGERVKLRLHLAICVACERLSKQFDFMRRTLRQYPGPDEDTKK
jgi:hypothetical protein